MPESIRTQDLTLDAGGERRVGPLTLDLSPTGVTVIMGANGAGKSLLLRLLHGLVAPTSGTVEAQGRQAMVFQRPVMLRRSVEANLLFALKRENSDADPRARCREILERINLADRAKQPAQALSGGEQQRLALARALATNPETLFLDEPTASLDPAATLAIEAMVQEAAENRTKVILVTHDIGQARRVADDVVFLQNGALAEHTLAAKFFDAATSPQARAYLNGQIVL